MAILLGNTQLTDSDQIPRIAKCNQVSAGDGPFNSGSPTIAIAIGQQAQFYTCSCPGNIAIGFQTLRGFNTANCNPGGYNTGIGYKAMYDVRKGSTNLRGFCNIALGARAANNISYSNCSVFIGKFAGFSQNCVDGDTVVGKFAKRGYGSNGDCNVLFGYAPYFNSCGSCTNTGFMIAIGHCAARYACCVTEKQPIQIGYKAGNNTSERNITIGHASGTQPSGIMIGSDANAGGASGIGVGFQATPGGPCETIIGNANSTYAYIAAAWTNVSDCRDKTNVQTLPETFGLPLINKLRPVKFNWDRRNWYVEKCGFDFGTKDGTLVENNIQRVGFISQEVKQSVDELGLDFNIVGDSPKDTLMLATEDLIPSIYLGLKQIISDLEIAESEVQNLKNN